MNRVITVILFLISNATFGQNETTLPVFQTGHYSCINHIEFHKDNQYLVTCADDGRLVVWDIYLGLQFYSVLAHETGLKTFSFLNDTTLITLSNNGFIQQWSFPDLKQVSDLVMPVEDIQDFAVINSDKICLVGRQVYVYDIRKNQLEYLDYYSKALFSTVYYQPLRKEIVVSGPTDNYCVTISLENPYQFKTYVLGNINQALYAGQESLLMAETNGSLVDVNLTTSKRRTYNLRDNHNYVTSIATANNHIALASTYGFSLILNAENHALITTIGLNGVAQSAIDYSPNGKWLAVANHDGMITLFETENYKPYRVLKGVSASITDVQLFGEDLFVGYSDGIIRKINLPDNKIISNSIKRVSFEELLGINYSILSIDSFANDQLQFTVLRTDRHHEKNNLLRSADKMQSVWNLSKNEIVLKKEIDDIQLRLQVDHNFKSEIHYQVKHYLEEPTHYNYSGKHYYYNTDSSYFMQIGNGDTLIYETRHEAPISGLRFSEKHPLIISFSSDGSIRFWDTEGKYLATLYLSGQYGFTYWAPENFYFSSKEMLEKIGFIYKEKLLSYEQFDVFYNRPAEVMKHLPFFSATDITDYEKAYYKRLEKLGIEAQTLLIKEDLPEINVHYTGDYSTKSDLVEFTLELNGRTNNLHGYGYHINGIQHQFTLENTPKKATVNLKIQLASGLNQIEFFCWDTDQVNSLIKKTNITCEEDFDPELYLVSIGVSNYADSIHNLVYAQKDAGDIAQLMQKNKQFDKVHNKTLYNADFTRANFEAIKTFLSAAKVNDVILLYYAGHGILDQSLDYYLATYDMDFEQPQLKGLAFDNLEAYFESLICRNKIILVDACFSGELDKGVINGNTNSEEELENGDIQFRSGTSSLLKDGGEMGIFELAKMTFIDLNRNNSTNILSSASGVEYAMESDEWQNGLFTYALKDGIINKKADLNGDNSIRIMELQVYLRETVSSLSNGRQNPILRKENNKNNFVIW